MKTKKQLCPLCKMEFKAHTHLGKPAKPSPGDLSVCFFCATMLMFNENMDLEILTDEQFFSLDENLQIQMNETIKIIVNKRK